MHYDWTTYERILLRSEGLKLDAWSFEDNHVMKVKVPDFLLLRLKYDQG